MGAITNVLYYGIFASFTGGWLPLRSKNPNRLLVISHLYSFLIFITAPLTVFLIDAEHIWGWLVYTILIAIFFLLVKSINYRLHRVFGIDPVVVEEETKEETKDEDTEVRKKPEQDVDTDGDLVDEYPTKKDQVEKTTLDIDMHKSASSLNSTTDMGSVESSGGVLEMSRRSSGSRHASVKSSPKLNSRNNEEETPALVAAVKSTEDNYPQNSLDPISEVKPQEGSTLETQDGQGVEKEDGGNKEGRDEGPKHDDKLLLAATDVSQSSEGLHTATSKKPHHSSLNDVTSVSECDVAKSPELSSSSSSLQRSVSMPTQRRSNIRNNNRARICVRPPRSSQRSASSSSQQQHHPPTLSTSATTQPPSPPVNPSTPKDGDYVDADSNASSSCLNNKAPVDVVTTPASPTHHPYTRQLSDMYKYAAAFDEYTTDGARFTVELVEKLPPGLCEAIEHRTLPSQTYSRIMERQRDLRRGHLPSTEYNYGNNDLYWWEESDGNWDFELVSTEVTTSNNESQLLQMDSIEREIALMAGEETLSGLYQEASSPIVRRRASGGWSRRPNRTSAKPVVEQPPSRLVFQVLPYWKKWKLDVTFSRTLLEDFMDRNISIYESVSGVVLAVLVCVVTALLLNIGFYKNFWVFTLCYVVGGAHFSLLKNASPDPASPTPGQNRTTAFSRGFYFVLVGMLAFLINIAIENGPQDPLNVYHFNLSSHDILLFVRDGLLIFILFFPIIFTVGLLPQVDTFIIYFGEQIDINVFGGTAATGLIPAVFSVLHSVVCAGLLYIIGYAALLDFEAPTDCSVGCADLENSCPIHGVYAIYMGLLFAASYHLSRMSSNPEYIFELMKNGLTSLSAMLGIISRPNPSRSTVEEEEDPLDALYKKTVLHRLLSDLMMIPVIFFVVFSVSLSTVFCHTHDSEAGRFTIYGITCVLGVINHYIVPHVRKEMPWLCFGGPLYIIATGRDDEPSGTKVTLFEKFYQWSLFVERNLMYPLSFLIAFHRATPYLLCKFGEHGGALVLSVVGLRLLRGSFGELSRQHIIFIFTLLFFNFDYEHYSESLPLDYFVISLLFYKFYDLLLKVRFIVIYISPWLFSWGSVAHLVLQPLLIPHAPLIFFMTLMASLFNAPVNPIVASTLFIISYVRPVKFWEKNYNTKRLDNSQTRLQSQLDQSLRQPSHEHLDSLFYEHLTWALQKTLAGDLQLGRWGRVTAGDIFILSGDRLNALVHIIEYGNGFVTFQIRGLEFRGTYCHQREVEAITESESDDGECCCCEPGHLPGLLSFNAAVRQRWLAWEVVSRSYTVPGYSISENQADYVFNAHEYRKNYISFFVQSMIYLFIKSPNLTARLDNQDIKEKLKDLEQDSYTEESDVFSETLDNDYQAGSITRGTFLDTYYSFIDVCATRALGQNQSISRDQRSHLVTMCFACSLLGRRLFYQVMNTRSSHWNSIYCDYFLHGLYSMFVGDARPSGGDEWVYHDFDILKEVVLPAVRIALKLHQDYFTYSEQYRTPGGIYSLIEDTHLNHVVAHEGDRAWRNAIILNRPSLLAMRYQRTNNDGTEILNYPYTLVRLASRYIKFKVVKINRECVRSLWASQQHELIFLQNDDSERGSIQNAKPVLRNMVNSSMDLPIGYPVYVSPLTTSYIDEHESINKTIIGKYAEPLKVLQLAKAAGESCVQCAKSSLSSSTVLEKSTQSSEITASGGPLVTSIVQHSTSVDSLTGLRHSGTATATGADNASIASNDSVSEFMNQMMKPKWISKTVVIADVTQVQDSINDRWLKSPDPSWLKNGNKKAWQDWYPEEGMTGIVVHEWKPSHPKIEYRSHLGKIIVLIEIENHFVPILEDGVADISAL